MSKIGPIDDQRTRSWRLRVNGEVVPTVERLELEDPRFGCLTYGRTPAGYDGWSFRVSHGGGVVIAPFAIVNGVLYVGVVEQLRHNQGGMVQNVPRGFCEPRESYLQAAARELFEETGNRDGATICFPMQGEPVNQDSASFDTSGDSEGVRFFAARITPDQLEPADVGLRIRGSENEPISAAAREEQIASLRFIPWTEATHLGDMFTLAAVARLLAYLTSNDELKVEQARP